MKFILLVKTHPISTHVHQAPPPKLRVFQLELYFAPCHDITFRHIRMFSSMNMQPHNDFRRCVGGVSIKWPTSSQSEYKRTFWTWRQVSVFFSPLLHNTLFWFILLFLIIFYIFFSFIYLLIAPLREQHNFQLVI